MSTNWLKDVREFRKVCKLENQSCETAWRCIADEQEELICANVRTANELDACIDLIVTIIGYMESQGYPVQEAWDLVHAANMTKAGGPKSPDGKQLKPEGWKPPDIEGLLKGKEHV